ncbi:nucleotidyltransferase family protein [Winogradskyella aurantia]|uniref:nucleotidyltransferase family protein n=1 Tax=Winogradskyella aurantia TaxID=1915063 RepID=UPI0013FDD76C|nr:nucleotidyltransferase family protein [Winogradskyella aurantia]
MGHLSTTYQRIADILSFEVPTDTLEGTLNQDNFDWDAIVVEGSKHLVLPAIYCRLKAKNLLHCLPVDLKSYLEELTAINRNRNTAILKQVNSISDLLQKHHIPHVFLKGSALLALNVYEDLAERMVGDIDILIEKQQIQKAFHVLRQNGYSQTRSFNYQTNGFRHLDSLINPNALAAVELHEELFNQRYTYLMRGSEMLNSKMTINSLSMPKPKQLYEHIILASQVNDYSYFYNSFNFKIAYDTLVLSTMNQQEELNQDLVQTKYGMAFLSILQFHFKDFRSKELIKTGTRKLFLYKLENKFPILRSLIRGLKYLSFYIFSRLELLLTNMSYRKYIINKIFIFDK